MRAAARILAVVVFVGVAIAPYRPHLALDPDEPIAADASLTAGHARTIFDFEPVLGAFGDPRPPRDPDDPAEFEAYLELQKPWTDRNRDAIAQMLGPIDWSLCEDANRSRLITAVTDYNDARGRQKASFALRGRRARAYIEQVWSTPLDRQIDVFVRQLATSGFLQLRDVPGRSYPEFAKVVANTAALGKTCPRPHTERP
jgi:hypothetical protein